MPGTYYILLSLALFFIGTAGALLRRNALFVLMSLELQLGAGSPKKKASMDTTHAAKTATVAIVCTAFRE